MVVVTMAAEIAGGGWTCLRPLGRGASGAAVVLAADDASGEVFVVKSSAGSSSLPHHNPGAGMQQLRRECSVMLGLSSPHVLECLGYRSSGEDQLLFLEFAPGGSLADVVARNRGRLEEAAVRAYAADVVRGLDYLHRRRIVHGDVKGSNVLLGADGSAKIADFGCARAAGDSGQMFGGTPAFMAPEVARGEEQGPPADVWALGCTVIEMTTGRAPWSGTDNVLAAMRRIGFTDAVPDIPECLSPEAKDFLGKCLQRRAGDRSTAAQLVEHPFVAVSLTLGSKKEQAKSTDHWVSPTSALDAALWESESDDDDEFDHRSWNSPIGRIRAIASSSPALPPDWESDEGWIEVLINPAPAAEIDELLECPVKLNTALACPPSSMPENCDSEQRLIEVCPAPSDADASTDEEEHFHTRAAAELSNDALRAVCSVAIGDQCSQYDLGKGQEKNASISLSYCSKNLGPVLLGCAVAFSGCGCGF